MNAIDTFTTAKQRLLTGLPDGVGEGNAISVPSTLEDLLKETQFVSTASVLCTLAEMAEFAGREGPDLLHGGILCYFGKDIAEPSVTYASSYRPLSLEPLNSGLFGALDDLINSSCDSSLVFAAHLWPLPWLQSCYLAAVQAANGARVLILIGPRDQTSILPLETESNLLSGLANARAATFNHDTSSPIEALLMLSGMPVSDPGDWDIKLVTEYANVNAIRAAGNDLFADLWSSARFSILLNPAHQPTATKPDNTNYAVDA